MEQALKVCVFGATGYTGIELLRILFRHPKVEVTELISASNAGKPLGDVVPSLGATPYGSLILRSTPAEDFDIAFLCLPHESSLNIVPELVAQGKRVIDLSGAYRIKDRKAYPKFYGFEHTHGELLEEAVYGLPEIFRKDIKKAKLVANPGCYPTATLLAIYPLLKAGVELEGMTVHALSGVSGAGRKPRQHFHFPEMEENFFAYSVEKHRHVPEMENVARRIRGKDIRLRFTPVVVPASRGMLSTVYVKTEPINFEEIYKETYANEPFVKVLNSPPMTKWVLGTNLCLLYPFYDKRTGDLVVISAIDNLGKGASHQAVQNMNIMFGFDETTALPKAPLFP